MACILVAHKNILQSPYFQIGKASGNIDAHDL